MDYLELLKKYMKHVADEEGCTFVGRLNSGYSDVEFSEEEVRVLEDVEESLE